MQVNKIATFEVVTTALPFTIEAYALELWLAQRLDTVKFIKVKAGCVSRVFVRAPVRIRRFLSAWGLHFMQYITFRFAVRNIC
mmetsp:Transcript_93803/g.274672  ORF Transcript_93803/g.274672 Transcript_93803/m.274672 type:complete len:83 (-) Transcript_93803:798-1046(-)